MVKRKRDPTPSSLPEHDVTVVHEATIIPGPPVIIDLGEEGLLKRTVPVGPAARLGSTATAVLVEPERERALTGGQIFDDSDDVFGFEPSPPTPLNLELEEPIPVDR